VFAVAEGVKEAVGDFVTDGGGDPIGGLADSALVAGGAVVAAFAGEGEKAFVAAVRAVEAEEAGGEVATAEEVADGGEDVGGVFSALRGMEILVILEIIPTRGVCSVRGSTTGRKEPVEMLGRIIAKSCRRCESLTRPTIEKSGVPTSKWFQRLQRYLAPWLAALAACQSLLIRKASAICSLVISRDRDSQAALPLLRPDTAARSYRTAVEVLQTELKLFFWTCRPG
jgi:hypothetical protein